MMAISWSAGLLDKVMAVSKFALLQLSDSFLNLPNDIESVSPNASAPPTVRGEVTTVNTISIHSKAVNAAATTTMQRHLNLNAVVQSPSTARERPAVQHTYNCRRG